MFLENKYSRAYFTIIEAAKARKTLDGYFEKHHIIPKSLGGSNLVQNLVKLTAKEHYICHRLLTKMLVGRPKYLMMIAACRMIDRNNIHQRHFPPSIIIARLLEGKRHAISRLTKGKPKHSAKSKEKLRQIALGRPSPNKGRSMSDDQKAKIAETLKGRPPSPETVAKIHAKRAGYRHTEETKRKIADGNRGKSVGPMDEVTKQKISEALKGKPKPWIKGRPEGYSHDPESIGKMRQAHAGREIIQCEHCLKSIPKPNYARWHGANCKSNT